MEIKKCINCIHYKLCARHGEILDILNGGVICDMFTNESRVVQLPCLVGDTMWYVRSWRKDIQKCRVSMLQQKANKSWKFRISYPDGGVSDFTLDEIGKYIFLTEEDAKKKLEELDV